MHALNTCGLLMPHMAHDTDQREHDTMAIASTLWHIVFISLLNNFIFISANYKQADISTTGETVFKAEKSIALFPRRSKLPSTKRVTLKTIADTIVSLSHDAQDDLPSNSVVVLERYNVTGASGVIKRYPNGSDFKMELTFRLNRNGVASLDSSEVMLEDRIEYEKCEFVKPAPPPKTTKEADAPPAAETDGSSKK